MASLRILILALACTGVMIGVLSSSPSPAPPLGDYHNGATLICSDCHVMHGQQSHGYDPAGVGAFNPVGAGGPFTYLLRNTINDLCLYCHNNNSVAPDVLEDNNGKYPLDVRQAGALNIVGSASATYLGPTGHTLESTDTAPGGTWNDADGLHCTNCHAQHGYAAGINSYRNLINGVGTAASGTTPVTYNDASPGTNVPANDVFQRAALSYDIADMDFNEPNTSDSAYATWCMGCHTNFHGSANVGTGPTQFVRHPQANVDIGAVGGGHSSSATFSGHTNNVKVMDPAGLWDGTGANLTPSCFSCHKAHGNQNGFGLIYMSGTGTVDEEGDDGTAPKALCGQCHVQG